MCFGDLIGFWVLCLFVNLLLFVRMFFCIGWLLLVRALC